MAMAVAPLPHFDASSFLPPQLSPSVCASSASGISPWFQPYVTRHCSASNSSFASRRSALQLQQVGRGRRVEGRVEGNSVGCRAGLEALVFDCDGVILESEDLHRRAYNAAFEEFQVVCPQSPSPLVWTPEFYDELQNQIGGGKPKMRWYFGKYGWPTSTIFPNAPTTEQEQATLIDTIQDWKTEKYKDIIGSGAVEPRPGVLQLMDATREKGIKLAVCSAATKSSVVFCLTNLLGKERFEGLDCFLAGDDVDKKKPDPKIYKKASEALGVAPKNCLVVEDSVIGLQAASGAGMACIISYTSSTSNQDFSTAKAVYPDLGTVRLEDLVELVEGMPATL